MRTSRGIRSGSKPHDDGRDGVSVTDLVYLLAGRSEKERSNDLAVSLNAKGKSNGGHLRLIATVNMASGTFTRLETRQIGMLRRLQQKRDSVVERTVAAWKILPSRLRLAVIVTVALLLGILIGLFVQSHRSTSPSEPVWKSFTMSR
ncbi:MAG TPA: hypothetical protein VJN65_08880 [Bacteroidota bacterium]|nr:hypothetical protein [Bacteroidota bacterium]